ncbi:MAG: IS1595 family transposase [Acidobacteriia bacterium]|nr:IS1595 family transposase [Terriglobia bacterium]
MLSIADNPQFQDAEKAREFLESLRWPDGPVCPHCNCMTAYKLTAKANSKKPVRIGVYKCKDCEQQFTVTVNTIFEDSHIPLNKWLLAIHLLCASKKGMSAHQLHRMLGVTYKSAWFMAHRIRYMMGQSSFQNKLKGVVEADETYIGGRRRHQGGVGRPDEYSHKQPVFSVLQRNGDVRSFHVHRVTADNLLSTLQKNVAQKACIVTDGFAAYDRVPARFKRHEVINHAEQEYSRTADDGMRVHTNTVEGYFGLLKRGLTGVYHHVGSHHLHRYLTEFDFRYNARKISDSERTLLALSQAEGKRLQLRDSQSKPTGELERGN